MPSSTSNLCPLCGGAGNLVTFSRGLEYWPCSPCGGAGVLVQHGPAVIITHGRPAKRRKGRTPAGEVVRFRIADDDEIARDRHSLRENIERARIATAGRYQPNPRIAAANLA